MKLRVPESGAGRSRPRVFFSGEGVQLRRVDYAAGLIQVPHEHEFASVTLVLRGECNERSEHDNHLSRACTILIKPPHVPHANYYGGREMTSLQIAFSPEVFREFPLGRGCSHLEGGKAAAAMIELLRAALAPGGPARVASNLTRVLRAVAHAYSCQRAAKPTSLTSEIAQAWVEPAEARVSVRALAQGLGMHPVSLARAFRRGHGASITEYLRRGRVVCAARRIAGGGDSLAQVAVDCGFADQPHLSRAFRAELGCTPGEFRRLIA